MRTMRIRVTVKVFILAVIIAFGLVVSSNPVQADRKELNVLMWCDHADPKLLRPFEEKYNVRINMKEYEGTGIALALIEQ